MTTYPRKRVTLTLTDHTRAPDQQEPEEYLVEMPADYDESPVTYGDVLEDDQIFVVDMSHSTSRNCFPNSMPGMRIGSPMMPTSDLLARLDALAAHTETLINENPDSPYLEELRKLWRLCQDFMRDIERVLDGDPPHE